MALPILFYPLAKGQGTVDLIGIPTELAIEHGDPFSVTLRVETNGNQISVADVVMQFDQALVEITDVSFSPSTLLNIPTILPNWDNNTGTLSFGALTIAQPAPSESFDFIVIQGIAINSGTTAMSYLTSGNPRTLLAFAGNDITGNLDIIEIQISQDISGCTNFEACNYNPLATIDDGSCLLPSAGCSECDGQTLISSLASDINSDFSVDIGDLVILLGEFGLDCPQNEPGCLGDINLDGTADSGDLLILLSEFG